MLIIVENLYESSAKDQDIILEEFDTAQSQIKYLYDLDIDEFEVDVIVLSSAQLENEIEEAYSYQSAAEESIKNSSNESQKGAAERTYKEKTWVVNLLNYMKINLAFEDGKGEGVSRMEIQEQIWDL